MAEKGSSTPKRPPMHKTIKTKATDQAKVKDPSQKTSPKKDLQKQNPPLEPEVVIVPIDQAQNQAPSNPQNLPDTGPPAQIPDLPSLPNLPAHIPNPPPLANLPVHI